MTRPWFLLVLLLLVVGCLPAGRGTSPEAILERTNAGLTDVAFENVLTFAGARLFAYMNGAAEAYYAKGFRVMASADTTWRKTEAKIELFQVNTPANAKALFEEFLADGSRELPAGLGSAAWYARELEGIFHRGPYFCRVIVYGNDNEAKQLLDLLSAAIDQVIPD